MGDTSEKSGGGGGGDDGGDGSGGEVSARVAWVKVGKIWWPGKVLKEDEMTDEMRAEVNQVKSKKSKGGSGDIYVVKFFNEEEFEVVRNPSAIILMPDEQKKLDLIKRAISQLKYTTLAENRPKFKQDVLHAERLLDPSCDLTSITRLLDGEPKTPTGASKYADIFPSAKPEKPSPLTATTPGSRGKSGAVKLNFLYSSRIINTASSKPPSKVSPLPSDPSKKYHCNFCGYSSDRVNCITNHMKYCSGKSASSSSNNSFHAKSPAINSPLLLPPSPLSPQKQKTQIVSSSTPSRKVDSSEVTSATGVTPLIKRPSGKARTPKAGKSSSTASPKTGSSSSLVKSPVKVSSISSTPSSSTASPAVGAPKKRGRRSKKDKMLSDKQKAEILQDWNDSSSEGDNDSDDELDMPPSKPPELFLFGSEKNKKRKAEGSLIEVEEVKMEDGSPGKGVSAEGVAKIADEDQPPVLKKPRTDKELSDAFEALLRTTKPEHDKLLEKDMPGADEKMEEDGDEKMEQDVDEKVVAEAEDDDKIEKKDDHKVEKKDVHKIEKKDDDKMEKMDDEKMEKKDEEKMEKEDEEKMEKKDGEKMKKMDDEKMKKMDDEKMKKKDDDKIKKKDEEKLVKEEEVKPVASITPTLASTRTRRGAKTVSVPDPVKVAVTEKPEVATGKPAAKSQPSRSSASSHVEPVRPAEKANEKPSVASSVTPTLASTRTRRGAKTASIPEPPVKDIETEKPEVTAKKSVVKSQPPQSSEEVEPVKPAEKAIEEPVKQTEKAIEEPVKKSEKAIAEPVASSGTPTLASTRTRRGAKTATVQEPVKDVVIEKPEVAAVKPAAKSLPPLSSEEVEQVKPVEKVKETPTAVTAIPSPAIVDLQPNGEKKQSNEPVPEVKAETTKVISQTDKLESSTCLVDAVLTKTVELKEEMKIETNSSALALAVATPKRSRKKSAEVSPASIGKSKTLVTENKQITAPSNTGPVVTTAAPAPPVTPIVKAAVTSPVKKAATIVKEVVAIAAPPPTPPATITPVVAPMEIPVQVAPPKPVESPQKVKVASTTSASPVPPTTPPKSVEQKPVTTPSQTTRPTPVEKKTQVVTAAAAAANTPAPPSTPVAIPTPPPPCPPTVAVVAATPASPPPPSPISTPKVQPQKKPTAAVRPLVDTKEPPKDLASTLQPVKDVRKGSESTGVSPTNSSSGGPTPKELAQSQQQQPPSVVQPSAQPSQQQQQQQQQQGQQTIEGDLASPDGKKSPALVAQRVVHLVPVENADGSITYMLLSLENGTDNPAVVLEQGADQAGSVLRLDKVEPMDTSQGVEGSSTHVTNLPMNPNEVEGIFLDKTVDSPNAIVSALTAATAAATSTTSVMDNSTTAYVTLAMDASALGVTASNSDTTSIASALSQGQSTIMIPEGATISTTTSGGAQQYVEGEPVGQQVYYMTEDGSLLDPQSLGLSIEQLQLLLNQSS